MFISGMSKFGAQILKRTRKNQFSVTGKQFVQGPLRRYLYPATNLWFSSTTDNKEHEDHGGQNEKISVTFVEKDGTEMLIKAPVGMSLLEVAHENDIELEGACEGSCACSTCHVIVMDAKYYNELDDPKDEENDMLDLAFGLTETSRLGCQVILNSKLDGIRVAIPAATQNISVDGYAAKRQ